MRITVEREREPEPTSSLTLRSSGSFEIVEGPLAGEARLSGSGRSSRPASVLDEEAFLAATVFGDLGALDLGPHTPLAWGLHPAGLWSGRARIARALRAGISARRVLAGERDFQHPSPSLGTRNRVYLVLRCRAHPTGFFTESARTFFSLVPHEPDGRLETGAVCHGFPSRSEALAFAAGAQASWPREL